MNLLSWQAMAWAAALTVPPLVALYFLKLRRSQRPVASTLLWRRTVEDFHVNAPFQRLRRNLLMFLQILVLLLGAFALGKPMLQQMQTHEDNVLILVDQSASMGVVEADSKTRLESAKQQAKKCVDSMGDDARAMVIAFCDRASVVSSFDSDRNALKRKIDSIEQTDSTTTLGEAVSLAEAYAQNIIIGTKTVGQEISRQSAAGPASVFVFTDGRISDGKDVTLQRLETRRLTVTPIGARDDNVGIVAMDARRSYDEPNIIEVAATVQNFGAGAANVDGVLYIDGKNTSILSSALEPGIVQDSAAGEQGQAPPGSAAVFSFVHEFPESGVVEVALHVNDALAADNRAFTIVPPPRNLRVLLVTRGNQILHWYLNKLVPDTVAMTPNEYESTDEKNLSAGDRSLFDVVILDGHSTKRLPAGNYLFWGAVPDIEGVGLGPTVSDEVIFNWDDTHPLLRYVAPAGIEIYQWHRLRLPPEAVSIVDGETSSVIAYLAREASQFVLCAFTLIVAEEGEVPFENTTWVREPDFVIFMQNTLQFLAANVAMTGAKSIAPGQPITLPAGQGVQEVRVHRPDNTVDTVPVAGYQTIHYARTRNVGVYRLDPPPPTGDAFAVSLKDPVESRVQPAQTITIGAETVQANAGALKVDEPAWRYALLAALAIVLLEWLVYTRRVLV